MTMSTHATSGVEKGLNSANRMPVEVMGFLHGHVDPDVPTTFVVTDAFPLPVEGTETSVVIDSPDVQNYMIALQTSLEATRAGNCFVGWYHSHPFDVSTHSAAFLSSTDVSSQLGWQLNEDRAGNPWFALVVDPLRSKAKGRPIIGAFRCHPTNFQPPKGHAPDGKRAERWRSGVSVSMTFNPRLPPALVPTGEILDDRALQTRWGSAHSAYYSLEVEYFMAARNAALMNVLARDYMWARVLSSTPTAEREVLERVPARISKIGDAVAAAERDVMVSATAKRHGLGSLMGDNSEDRTQQSHHGNDVSLAEAARAGASGVAAEGALAAAELAGEALRAQAATALRVKFFCGCGTPAGAPPPTVVAATLSATGLASTLEVATAQAVRVAKPS